MILAARERRYPIAATLALRYSRSTPPQAILFRCRGHACAGAG